jgi:AsmA family
MQDIDPTYEQDEASEPISTRGLRRLLYVAFAALALLLLVLLPPLISVNRFQHRIATSISDSLGRPVHLDSVTLNLLPLPGFTLENFVVSEDPTFGTEPIIRANSVRATLRISSLWTKRIEFSSISFTEPSVNLVHAGEGKWNLQSILLHAAHIDAAPTAQRRAGPTPRFPYIEATGARLNLKLDREKTPLSLTDADFALWLPDPQEWHLRLKAHPARTDANVSDTGVLQLEGTLGRAASLGQVPINLTGEWSGAPLGAASLVLLGRDAGLRGEMTLSASAQGTVGTSTVQTRLRLANARRADFVPERSLDLDLQCLTKATSAFYRFEDIHCDWPPSGSSSAPTLAITGTLPDIRRLSSATLDAVTPGLPAATLLEWMHIASSRVPADITAAGSLTGHLSYRPNPIDGLPRGWTGKLLVTGAKLINPHAGSSPLVVGDVDLQSIVLIPPPPHRGGRQAATPPPPSSAGFQLAPTSLALGGKEPATLDGHFDSTGYTLHLTGMASTARMLALATALPPFGDGLAQALPTNRATGPYRVDLTATRAWRGPQVWSDATSRPVAPHPHHRIHR